MSTKAEQFMSKIRNLKDCRNKIVQNAAPSPTGVDIANTLKYFIHTLRSILKDAPEPTEPKSSRRRINDRLPLFPTLDYGVLYETLVTLVDIVPLVQYGQFAFGQHILQLFACMPAFLEPEISDTIPHTVASTLAIFPSTLQKETVELLCTVLLPICLTEVQEIDEETYANMSVSAIILLVLQHCKNKAHHAQLLECIMTYKKHAFKDMLCIIAFGPSAARGAAANLLFHYWPTLRPLNVDDDEFTYTCWKPVLCQRTDCLTPVNNVAVKMCMDPTVAGKHSKNPPPLYLCSVCSEHVSKDMGVDDATSLQMFQPHRPKDLTDMPLPQLTRTREMDKPLLNVLQPFEHVSKTCENKNCSSSNRTARYTCYSSECTQYHDNFPVRYCTSCYAYMHSGSHGGGNHILQEFPNDPLSYDKETQSYLVEAIISKIYCHVRIVGPKCKVIADNDSLVVTWCHGPVLLYMGDLRYFGPFHLNEGMQIFQSTLESLLKEAHVEEKDPLMELAEAESSSSEQSVPRGGDDDGEGSENDEEDARLLSRYGLWLLIEKCTPTDRTPDEVIGRLISMLFQWYCDTATLTQDSITLEDLKQGYVTNWLLSLLQTHFNVFVSCLLPQPPEYAKVGGHWDTLSSRVTELQEGLRKVFSMTPYNAITYEVWDYIMPHWMESISTDVVEEDVVQLQDVICKLLDVDMCPLPFPTDKLYNFVSCKFNNTKVKEQEKALLWLQVLSEIELVVPLKLLMGMFKDGLASMNKYMTAKKQQICEQKKKEQQQPHHQQPSGQQPGLQLPSDSATMSPPPMPSPAQEVTFSVTTTSSSPDHTTTVPVTSEPPHVTIDPSPLTQAPGDLEVVFSDEDEETMLRCFVFMLDLLLLQCDLQFIDEHKGFKDNQSKEFVSMLTEMLQISWGLVHKCPSPNEQLRPCSLCELSSLWFQLALKILERISPSKEINVSEMPESLEAQFEKMLEGGMAMNKMNNDVKASKKNRMSERAGTKRQKRSKDSPNKGFLTASEEKPVDVFQAERVTTTISLKDMKEKAAKKAAQKEKKKEDDTRFKMEDLSVTCQLLYLLLKEIPKYKDPDVLLHLFDCIKMLCLSAECLRQASNDHVGFLTYAQLNLLIPSFWILLNGEISQVTEIIVPLIIHCLALKKGSDVMWELMERDMLSEDWQARFRATERIAVLLRFVEKKSIGNSAMTMAPLAHMFSELINATNDICPAVSTRAIVMLETIPKKVNKELIRCLEYQWDSVVEDRVLIMNRLYTLRHFLPTYPIMSWQFFMSRFDTLALEAHVDSDANREFPFPIDQSRSGVLRMARYGMHTKEQIAKIARNFSDPSVVGMKPRRLSAASDKRSPKSRSHSAPTFTTFLRPRFLSIDRSTYSRPSLSSRQDGLVTGSLADSVFADGHLQTVEEEHGTDPGFNLTSLDKETVHQLIFLLTKFMTHDVNLDDDEQVEGRAMNTVLRHLNILLGYKQIDKTFNMSPQALRESAVYCAFMAGLPRLLDHNVGMGNMLLPMVLELLRYSPSPQKNHSDIQPHDYTLWFLEPHCRHSWLMSLLLILYKYDFEPTELKNSIKVLVRVCINLLEAQQHQCKPKRPEPPQPEDIWGATTPSEKKKRDSLQGLFDAEEGSEGSVPSAGPSSPLLAPTTREIHAGIQHMEVTNDSLFESSEEVIEELTPKAPSRSFVASTIMEVEEEECEEMVESLEPLPLNKSTHMIPVVKASMITKADTVVSKASAQVVTDVQLAKVEKVETHSHKPVFMSAKHESPTSERSGRSQSIFRKPRMFLAGSGSSSSNLQKRQDQRDAAGGESPNVKGQKKCKKEKKKKEKKEGKSPEKKSSVYSAVRRYHEDKNYMALTKCTDCGVLLEEYDDDTISLAIVILSTFVHRDPEAAASLLLEMLQVVSRIASAHLYPWQADSIGSPPGYCCSVAKQFLRCTLHQLAPNGIFPQLFLSKIEDPSFLRTMAIALTDFSELSPTDAISYVLEGLNDKRSLPTLRILLVIMNLAEYMENLPLEGSSAWSNLIPLFETFFRKLAIMLPENCDLDDMFCMMIVLLKCPATKVLPSLLDPMTKIISFAIQKARFKLKYLMEMCSLSSRIFSKEREKMFISRVVILELVNALKFKSSLPDINLIQLVQFVLLDAGGRLTDFISPSGTALQVNMDLIDQNTGAMECLKQYLTDCIEYVGDLHTLTKVKDNLKGGSYQNLNEDTLGSQLKAGVAQIVALEFTRSNMQNNKAVQRYLPWLYHPPSAMQQGPKEFIDCIAHIRLLSWLLLGSLTHSAVCPQNGNIAHMLCQPIPLEAGIHIADHVQVILAGFAEQSKASVLHMSSLFHVFILCQLWTMYCEQMATINPLGSEGHHTAMMCVMDFWGRVTPGILQLLSHSKVLADMVNLHFLSLMEALQECNSSVLAKLFPMWTPILFSYPAKLSGNLQVRLQNCENWPPPSLTKGEIMSYNSSVLLKWLKKLQFKMGQIEIQSSAATQLYTV